MTSRLSASRHELHCDSCGQLPEAPRFRSTLASVAAVLPIELLVHLVVIDAPLSLPLKVVTLASVATILVVWIAEPSVRRVLWSWLHGRELLRRRRLGTAATLWRARVTLPDRPGALAQVTRALADAGVDIISVHVHRLHRGVLDELILGAAEGVGPSELHSVLESAGGRDVLVTPSTPVAVVDGQTRALTLANELALDPDRLGSVLAELLRADELRDPAELLRSDGTQMKVPSVTRGSLVLERPGEPFTPAESARAHRLAELAETLVLTGTPREKA